MCIRDRYNSFTHAKKEFEELIKNTNSKFIMISYNNGGIIPLDEMDSMLKKYGTLMKIPIDHKIYNRLRGIASYKREGEDEGGREGARSARARRGSRKSRRTRERRCRIRRIRPRGARGRTHPLFASHTLRRAAAVISHPAIAPTERGSSGDPRRWLFRDRARRRSARDRDSRDGEDQQARTQHE